MHEHDQGAEGHAQGREPGRYKPGDGQGYGRHVIACGPEQVAMKPATQAAGHP
jgi:hypothetical protein